MSKVISKPLIVSVCMISFIFLCTVFTPENAFSVRHWQKEHLKVTYDQKKRIIFFDFLYYDYLSAQDELGFLKNCDFYYSEDDNNYTYLMNGTTEDQKGRELVSINLGYKKFGENIYAIDLNRPENTFIFYDYRDLVMYVKPKRVRDKDAPNNVTFDKCYLRIKWELPKYRKPVKSIKINGSWSFNDASKGDNINEVYTFDHHKSNSNNKMTSVVRSEISEKVKVSGTPRAITVTGSEYGKEIKIYTLSGVEMKSVVANDEVVNITLPKNHIYIVKAGQTGYKVAL